jgi:hypothetical protein
LRLGLIAAVLALCGAVLYVGVNGVGMVVGGIGSTLGGFFDGVTATPTPRASLLTFTDPPSVQQPTEPYTAERTVDLVVTVPASLAGNLDHRLKVYLTLPDQVPTAIQDSALGTTTRNVIPVQLEDGINDFTVTIAGPAGESDASVVVRYVFDATPPKFTITSPKNDATVNAGAVTVTGKTQARTTLLARNEANGSSVAGTAGTDGAFKLSLALTTGVNKITISGTDPAGNVAESVLSVRRGGGKLTVSLTASTYQIKVSKLPASVTLFASVTDPDGRALAGADYTFTLGMPGIPTITIDGKTDADGKASFKTSVPKGADIGQGSATVLVTTSDFGSTTDFTVVSIVK